MNQSSNSFFIMYGTDNFKNAVPFKKVSLASYVLDTGTDASYVVTAKFVSYPLSEEVVTSTFESNTVNGTDPRDTRQYQSNSADGTWNVWPKDDDNSPLFYLYKGIYQKKPSPQSPTYTTVVPNEILIDNSFNIVPTLEFMFQNFITDYKKNSPPITEDFIPIIYLPPTLEGKILEAMQDERERLADSQGNLPIWFSQALKPLSKRLSNCGIHLLKRSGVDKTISNWGDPFEVDITFHVINPTSGQQSKINKSLTILNSLLQEFGCEGTSLAIMYITDPVHIREFIKLHFEKQGSSYIDPYITNKKNNTKEYLISVDDEEDGPELRPLVVIGERNFLRTCISVNPDIISRGDQAEMLQSMKENIKYSESVSEINMKKTLKGDGIFSYYQKLVEHYNYVDGEEMLGSEFSLNSGSLTKPSVKKNLLSLFEFYSVGRDQDDVLEVKVKNVDHLPLPFTADIFGFSQKPTTSTLDQMVKQFNIPPEAPLNDETIELIVNRVAQMMLDNAKGVTALKELLRGEEASAFTGVQNTIRGLLTTMRKNPRLSASNISSTTLINYLLYFIRSRSANRKISLKLTPKFRKYQSYSKDDHLIFLRIVNPNVPLVSNPLGRKSLITNLYQIEHIKHVANGSECYTQLELFVCPLASYLKDVEGLEEIYAKKLLDLANPEI
jgi:hypothetical protein